MSQRTEELQKPPHFLDRKNMAINTSMEKAVNASRKKTGKKENLPLNATETNSLLIIPLIAFPLLRSWYRISRLKWEKDKSAKNNDLKVCRAILGTQNWTSHTHNAVTDVSEWAKVEYSMHKKKLCSSEMTAYAAMCMVRDMWSMLI